MPCSEVEVEIEICFFSFQSQAYEKQGMADRYLL